MKKNQKNLEPLKLKSISNEKLKNLFAGGGGDPLPGNRYTSNESPPGSNEVCETDYFVAYGFGGTMTNCKPITPVIDKVKES